MGPKCIAWAWVNCRLCYTCYTQVCDAALPTLASNLSLAQNHAGSRRGGHAFPMTGAWHALLSRHLTQSYNIPLWPGATCKEPAQNTRSKANQGLCCPQQLVYAGVHQVQLFTTQETNVGSTQKVPQAQNVSGFPPRPKHTGTHASQTHSLASWDGLLALAFRPLARLQLTWPAAHCVSPLHHKRGPPVERMCIMLSWTDAAL